MYKRGTKVTNSRDKQFKLMLSEAEHAALRVIAERAGISSADILRIMLRDKADAEGLGASIMGRVAAKAERYAQVAELAGNPQRAAKIREKVKPLKGARRPKK